MTDGFNILEMTEVELGVLTPAAGVDAVEWIEENYVLSPTTSSIVGPYRFDYTPFFREPARLYSRPPVEIHIEACTQSGKSTLICGLVAYDYGYKQPGPGLFLMPRETDVGRRINTRLRPMFRENAILNRLIGGDDRMINKGVESVFANGAMFVPAWASSPAAMADNPIRDIKFDEPGKASVIEATGENPYDLIRRRQRTFPDRTLVSVSSPQDDGDIFDREMRTATDCRWHVPCMQCGRWHKSDCRIDEDSYIVLDTRDGKYLSSKLYADGGHAAYVCPHCKGAWSEMERWDSVSAGVWVPREQTMDPNGKLSGPRPVTIKNSFRVHAAMLHPRFTTIGDIAADFVEASVAKDRGDLTRLRDFTRNQQARPWKQVSRTVKIDALEAKKNDHPEGIVPNDVRVLVAGADFHKDTQGNVRVDYLVKGFANDLVNYDILEGSAGSLEEMFRVTTSQSFAWAEKTDRPELMLLCGFVDAGYQPENPDTLTLDEVYQFCRKYWRLKIWYPVRGRADLVEMFYVRPLDRVVERAGSPRRKKTAGQYRGMQLIDVSTNQLKDIVAGMAEAPMGSPASTSYNRDMRPEFLKQLTNEYKGKNAKGKFGWWPKEEHLPTHGLDTSVYATAAGYFKRVNEMWSETELAKIAETMGERGIVPRRVRLSEMPRRHR